MHQYGDISNAFNLMLSFMQKWQLAIAGQVFYSAETAESPIFYCRDAKAFELCDGRRKSIVAKPRKFPKGIQKIFIIEKILWVCDLDSRDHILSVVSDPRLANERN